MNIPNQNIIKMDKEEFEKIKAKFERQSWVEDLYSQKTKIQDNRFGEVTFWSKKKGKDLLLMKRRSNGDFEFIEDEVMQMKERLKMNNDFLMKMVDYSIKVPNPKFFEIWGFYKAPLQDLKREIKKRREINR